MRHAVVASFVASFVQLGLIGSVAGCGYPPLDKLPPREVKDFPVTASHDLDLLFLLMDDASSIEQQASLANGFPRFIDALSSIPGGLPNLHIGVATSDMGTHGEDGQLGPAIPPPGGGGCSGTGRDGVMQTSGATNAGMTINGNFLSDTLDPATGGRRLNYAGGTLAQVFARIATGVGAVGCAFEQYLSAVKRALTNPANASFLRDNAYLGVIILADEDDCSIEHATLLASDPASVADLGVLASFRCTRFGVTCDQGGQTPDQMNQLGTKHQCHPNDTSAYLAKVSDYAAFLKNLKPNDPSKVIAAGIVGNVDPFAVELRGTTNPVPALAHSCTFIAGDGKPEVADPAVRTKFFLDQFPNRSAFVSICQQDLSGGLQQIGELLKTALGYPCIEGTLADTDPKTPGPQYECDVTVTDPARGTQPPAALPRCTPEDATATNQPCWHLATDPVSCPSSDHRKVQIEGLNMLPGTADVLASCVLEPTT